MDETLGQRVIEAFNLASNASVRLRKAKLAQLEVETKWRTLNADLPEKLEKILKDEKQALDDMIKLNEGIKANSKKLDAETQRFIREAEFYEAKSRKITLPEEELKKLELGLPTSLEASLVAKTKKLDEIRTSLAYYQQLFGDMEPTNEALKQKIDELENKRISLEMTFDDSSTSLSNL